MDDYQRSITNCKYSQLKYRTSFIIRKQSFFFFFALGTNKNSLRTEKKISNLMIDWFKRTS